MNETKINVVTQLPLSELKRKLLIIYNIGDGDYKYETSLVIESDGTDEVEQAYRTLAEKYSSDDKEKSNIMECFKALKFAYIGQRIICDVFVRELNTIKVHVRDGNIQEIDGIPHDTQIQIIDYDTDGQETGTVEDGEDCWLSVWQG
jgi:hypothetical protein